MCLLMIKKYNERYDELSYFKDELTQKVVSNIYTNIIIWLGTNYLIIEILTTIKVFV